MDKVEEELMNEETTIRWLKDRSEIENTILNYAKAADFRDWHLLRTILADSLDVDFTSSGGPKGNVKAEEYVDQVKTLIPGFDVTQHQLTNFHIELLGDLCKTCVYMQAEHIIHTENETLERTVGGFYSHELQRVKGTWKISSLKLTETWSRGDMRAFVIAMERCQNR